MKSRTTTKALTPKRGPGRPRKLPVITPKTKRVRVTQKTKRTGTQKRMNLSERLAMKPGTSYLSYQDKKQMNRIEWMLRKSLSTSKRSAKR